MFKGEIRCKIFNFLTANSPKTYSMKQIFFSLKLKPEDTSVYGKVIKEGIASGLLLKTDNDKIRTPDDFYCGSIQIFDNNKYYIYLGKEKYLVSNMNFKNIFHGDLVLFKITDKYLLTVEILEILKHKNSKIRGTIMDSGEFAFLIPDDSIKYPSDIFISKKESEILVEAYDRVIVEISQFDIKGRPKGKVLYKLSNSEIVEDPLQVVIEKYGIEKDFSSEVKKKASMLKTSMSRTNALRRIDLRDEPIFTIDGVNCKDLDDAISIKKYGNNYELGVYIADVTNYVEEGSIIDKCAFDRGTSVYFIDKVVPMLPVELSNGICSLNPGENRLCLGMKIIYDSSGTILDREFFECTISSKKKFSYEEINSFLDGENEHFLEENKNLFENIEYGLELSAILSKKRASRNSMMFDFDAMEFELDIDGGVARVFPEKRGPANKMIEEFMIAANETVAELFSTLKFPYLYRIHAEPFEERLEGFFKLCKAYNIELPENPNNKDLCSILASIKDVNLKRGLSMNLITTMKQAKYSPENIGHFGLGSKYYCHFTSPIRRYPDLYNHRLLKRYIRKTINNDNLREYVGQSIEKVASHCCYTERNAAKAEDEYDKYKALEYFVSNSSNEYTGLVYSVGAKGLYILIDNCIPGFVRIKGFNCDADKFEGTINDKTYKVGDIVPVYFSEFDMKDKRLLFAISNNSEESK